MDTILINVADIVDPDDAQGRTFRQVAAEKVHQFPVDALVELDTGERLYVKMQTRDCDMTPMYSLGLSHHDNNYSWHHGFAEHNLTLVKV